MLFPVQVAIKLLPRGDFVKQYQTYVRREIQNQSSLRHPLIVSLREVRLAFSASASQVMPSELMGPSCHGDREDPPNRLLS